MARKAVPGTAKDWKLKVNTSRWLPTLTCSLLDVDASVGDDHKPEVVLLVELDYFVHFAQIVAILREPDQFVTLLTIRKVIDCH